MKKPTPETLLDKAIVLNRQHYEVGEPVVLSESQLAWLKKRGIKPLTTQTQKRGKPDGK